MARLALKGDFQKGDEALRQEKLSLALHLSSYERARPSSITTPKGFTFAGTALFHLPFRAYFLLRSSSLFLLLFATDASPNESVRVKNDANKKSICN